MNFAGLLVGIFVHTPSQHEGRLDVEHRIGRRVEDADALAARIVDLDLCVFYIGIRVQSDAGDD